MKKIALSQAAVLLGLLFAAVEGRAENVPLDQEHWDIQGQRGKFVEHLGRPSLLLSAGLALVKDAKFTDGVIEFDIAVAKRRAYTGVVFRVQDPRNFEEFYIRPHQSGNPDANQYQPVFHNVDAWQLYYGEGYSAPTQYEFDRWMHIKIAVSGKNAEVYIRDMETPALFVNELKRDVQTGGVGLIASSEPTYFSNFCYTAQDHQPLKGKPKAPRPALPGTVMTWQVSQVIPGKALEKKYQLTPADKEQLTWQKLDSESTGLTNLARLHGLEGPRNTVFARVTLHSDREQIKKVRFGFSDRVKVYFNDRLLYAGDDSYASRDYRFLGTMGLYDELYLPLQKGDNELWFAVTENQGGWGVQAVIEDAEGVAVRE